MNQLDKLKSHLPEGLTLDETLCYLIEQNMIVYPQDKFPPLNQICNMIDGQIQRYGEEMAGNAAHHGWNEIYALNKAFEHVAEARSILYMEVLSKQPKQEG